MSELENTKLYTTKFKGMDDTEQRYLKRLGLKKPKYFAYLEREKEKAAKDLSGYDPVKPDLESKSENPTGVTLTYTK